MDLNYIQNYIIMVTNLDAGTAENFTTSLVNTTFLVGFCIFISLWRENYVYLQLVLRLNFSSIITFLKAKEARLA